MIRSYINITIFLFIASLLICTVGFAVGYIMETEIIKLVSVLASIALVTSWTLYLVWNLSKDISSLNNTLSKAAHGEITDKEYKEGIFKSVEHQFRLLFGRIEDQKEKHIKEKENLNELITELSHQIKTPISSIKLFNEILIKDEESDVLVSMKTEIERLEWLSKVLLDISKLETGLIQFNSDSIYVKELINESISAVYAKAEVKGIEIIGNLEKDFLVLADPKWTKEAFINILDNAIKYTENGGQIIISTQCNALTSRVIIEDNGIGIHKKDIPNLFKRFYKGENTLKNEGTGIGLYLASEILSMSNARIKVKSSLNIGSTFEVVFH